MSHQRRLREPPPAFLHFCEGLHQGVLEMFSEVDAMTDYCLTFLKAGDLPSLRDFVSYVLASCDGAEIRALLRRTKANLLFDSKNARLFLEAVGRRLREISS